MQRRNLITALGFLAILSLHCAADTTKSKPKIDTTFGAGTTCNKADPGKVAAKSTKSSPTTRPCATQPDKTDGQAKEKLQDEKEKPSVTWHEITINGDVLKYRVSAGTMPMKDEEGKLKASVFFVAYEKASKADTQPADKDARGSTVASADPASRPITFVFNGGPGAAAVWLHLGTAGPRRIELKEAGEAPAPPYRLIDNPYTWLDVTDLVFIDPVGTGFSRPAKDEKREQFYGTKQDIMWVADFIRLYATKYERWLSPQFLAGESYGTTRAAGLSEYLLDRYGIALNGIILISSVLDFQTVSPQGNNDLPYALYLPSYAAAAWYHGKLSGDLQADLQKTLKEVERWAIGPYAAALLSDGTLDAKEREAIVEKLARYTAIPADFVRKSNLRIAPWSFEKLLLADKDKLIGRFDARITGADPAPTSSAPSYDPSLSRYFAIYSATFNDYVRRTLKYESVLPYEVLSSRVRPWKYGDDGDGYLFVVDSLRDAMVKNPHLKIMFASGYYDLATPYFATCYTINHLNLDPELGKNITSHFYPGGHMMYHNQPALQKLNADVVAFVRSALSE